MDHPMVTFVWKENLPLPSWHWANCETGATFSHLYWMQRSWIAWVISRHYFWLILLFYKWLCLVRVTFPVFLLSTKCMMVFFPSLLSNLVIFLLKKPFSIVIWHMGLLLDIICLMLSFWKLFCTLIVISMFL